MSTRLDYRTKLGDKFIGLDESGYGDFEYSDEELNTFLELSIARLYPAVYKRVVAGPLSLTGYGSVMYAYIDTPYAERVFLVEDANELTAVFGWEIRPGRIVRLDTDSSWFDPGLTQVNVYYHDAYTVPADDVTDIGIPAYYEPLVILGAVIEALSARSDTGIRGDDGPIGVQQNVSLIDRMAAQYRDLKTEMAMALPVVQL